MEEIRNRNFEEMPDKAYLVISINQLNQMIYNIKARRGSHCLSSCCGVWEVVLVRDLDNNEVQVRLNGIH